ncbi:MAG: hypothetical protein ABEJ94_02240 [Halorientalis sp.]
MSPQSRPIALLRRYSLALELVGTATGLLIVWYFTAISAGGLGGAAVGITAATIWPHVRRRYGIDRGWGKLPLGLGLIGLAAYGFAFTGGSAAIKATLLLVGAWLALDGLYDLRSGAGRTEPGAPDAVDRFGDAAVVGRSLEEEPKSVDELDDALDLPRERIEAALADLDDRDLVASANGRYESQLDDRGLTDALRTESGRASARLGSLPERVARPFRLFT